MNKLEVGSWDVLDLIRDNADKNFGQAGDLDTGDALSCFCQVGEDFFELYYSDLLANYIGHFDNEPEMRDAMKERFSELGSQLPEEIAMDKSFLPDDEG